MIRVNQHYSKLQNSYLFLDIGRRKKAFEDAHPEKAIINLGVGDVTEPLPKACRDALHAAADEMGDRSTFRGYGPEQGYPFLREAIARHDFHSRDADVGPDEIFISDGAKCDSANLQELFAVNTRIAIPDPVYPVYLDTNVMAGRTGSYAEGRYKNIVYLDSTPKNGYIPHLPEEPVDLIYLCFPNNPTGAVATTAQLQSWVDYARENCAIILFDAAYEAYIRNPELPHSIYEIEGAREVAIELRSFSKNAGFTGTRCAFTVIPRDLQAWDRDGDKQSLHAMWARRQSTKFNGVSYPIQRAAAAVYTPEGQAEIRSLTNFYMENARIIREAMRELEFPCTGGDNSPFLWFRTGGDSWAFFDRLLEQAGVVCIPGTGFGTCGEGHIRIGAFNSRENIELAMERIVKALAG